MILCFLLLEGKFPSHVQLGLSKDPQQVLAPVVHSADLLIIGFSPCPVLCTMPGNAPQDYLLHKVHWVIVAQGLLLRAKPRLSIRVEIRKVVTELLQ